MKSIVNSNIKILLVALFLLHAPLSCALDQTKVNNGNKEKTKIMNHQQKSCMSNSIIKSRNLIDFMLKDILDTYSHTGGGGITSIKEISTHIYEVSIAQEERLDVMTYELAIDDLCTVTLLKKSESSVSFGQ